MVLTVTYAPPGSHSKVEYSNSTMRGANNSLSGSFTNDTSWSVSGTMTIGGLFGITDDEAHVSLSYSHDEEQKVENSTSIEVHSTSSNNTTVPGPASSAVGLDHDEDIIWVWLNPVVLFDANYDGSFTWKGFGFDLRDPVGEADIVGINVAYLNGHAAMPFWLVAALQRTWAPPIICSSTDPACVNGNKSPALDAADLAEILKADPFADPSYVVNVPAGSTCTADHRFCRTNNQNMQYLPAPPGGQPIEQTYTVNYEVVATEGLAASHSTKTGISDEFGVQAKFAAVKLEAKFASEQTITVENKVSNEATQQTQQSASVTIVGPESSDNYTGPIQLDVFRDNLYGTFMFQFVPIQTFTFSVNPNSLGVIQGSCSNYNLLVNTLIPNFGGTINFQVSGLPANTSGVFNPASLNGGGSSILTICAAAPAPLGGYNLLITANYGAEVHSLPVTLGVNPPPNFTLTVSPAGQTILSGNSADFTVSTTSVSGFAGSVALSISGLPAGAVATFTPANVAVGSSSTLHISTSTSLPTGSYPLVITGISGAISHTATVVLGVTAPTPPPCTRPPCRVQN